MDERMRFVIRLKDGESMAALCREFQISRKTGYKVFERYEECGLEGLTDRARRPQRYAHQLPAQIEASIVAANTHRGVESCTSRRIPMWRLPPIPPVRPLRWRRRHQSCEKGVADVDFNCHHATSRDVRACGGKLCVGRSQAGWLAFLASRPSARSSLGTPLWLI